MVPSTDSANIDALWTATTFPAAVGDEARLPSALIGPVSNKALTVSLTSLSHLMLQLSPRQQTKTGPRSLQALPGKQLQRTELVCIVEVSMDDQVCHVKGSETCELAPMMMKRITWNKGRHHVLVFSSGLTFACSSAHPCVRSGYSRALPPIGVNCGFKKGCVMMRFTVNWLNR